MMRDSLGMFVEQALPELAPVISYETTDDGWRGITRDGEVLDVKPSNGKPVTVPSEIIVARAGVPVGRRVVTNVMAIDIDVYLDHFNRGLQAYKADRIEEALVEWDATLRAAPTSRARFNRAMVLLAAGRWHEGFDHYWQCEQQPPFMRPVVRDALDRGMVPWHGEPLAGKRLVLQHAHGYGDSLMTLRYVAMMRALGTDVVLDIPPVLRRMVSGPFGDEGDYFCPLLHLLYWLDIAPSSVDGRPYLPLSADLIAKWRRRLGRPSRKRIGIAWSVGLPNPSDYPREIPVFQLVAALGDAEIHSVQTQQADAARWLGVHVHEFEDFADCAGLMSQMDEIVSVDTAALHLAGAIGHPRVTGLLSKWASWRWIAPWYDNVRLCRQDQPDDWSSALAKLGKD
jgi:hypothetical protein